MATKGLDSLNLVLLKNTYEEFFQPRKKLSSLPRADRIGAGSYHVMLGKIPPITAVIFRIDRISLRKVL
jgi:hypothetical protein